MTPGGRSRPGLPGNRRRRVGGQAFAPGPAALAVAGLSGVGRISRRRLVALLLALIVAFVAVIVRLADVQAFSAGPYAALGLAQRTRAVTLPADRGTIFDRNGNALAMSVPQSTVYADPSLVTAPATEAAALAPVVGLDVATVRDDLSRPGRFAYVARAVDDDTAAAVRALNLPGIALVPEPRRFEPDGTLAAPVLGQVGIDDQGLSGLEYQYQAALAGRPGRLESEDDPSGRPIPGGFSRVTPATKGADLVLTLDRSLQYEVEQDLSREIVTAKAKGGMAIVMDRRTGEILAMADLTLAPDGTTVAPSSANDAVTTVYEPGSVEKLITMSAALAQGVVRPDDVLTVPDRVHVSDSWFSDDSPHPIEQWTPTDILTASSNVGTLTLGERVGHRSLVSYLHKFGLGSETAVRFPGESAGLLPSYWSGTTTATVSFGQGLAVTALQLVAAYNAIANGGVYVAPKLVKATVDGSGRTIPTPASATHRVVSPTVAREVTAMLTEVVRGGTGTEAGVSGYQVAGKTGTAKKSFEGQQGYAGTYVSSFAGFVPASNPAFTAMVVLDQPTPIYGGLVAAPVFRTVSTYALRELNVPPPAPEAALFDGVPHAQPSAATAADEPGKTGGFLAAATPSLMPALVDPPPAAVPPPPPPPPTTSTTSTTSTTTAPRTTTTTVPRPPPTTVPRSPPTTSLLRPVAGAATTAAPVTTTSTADRPRGAGSVGGPNGGTPPPTSMP